MINLYNDGFGQPYQDHVNALEYSEAQLDCVTAATSVTEWQQMVRPAPTPTVQALVDEFFDRLAEAFTLCQDAETLGDWRTVNSALENAVAVVERIDQAVQDS